MNLTARTVEESYHTVSVFSEWTFLAEGGHHVLLRYGGSERRFCSKVLRVEKEILSLKQLPCAPTKEEEYLRHVIAPLVSDCYMYHPQVVHIDSSFVLQLNDMLKSDESRFRKELVCAQTCVACIFPDVTNISPHVITPGPVDSAKLGKCISIEIKVKNGFKSVSPFAENRIKHACSRFQLNQYVKHYRANVFNKGMNYGGDFPGISLYQPEDLCSREKLRVVHGLECLFKNPQNNLKVFVEGAHIFGLNKLHDDDLVNKCSELFALPSEKRPLCPCCSNPNPIDILIEVISDVLCNESALEQLRYIQSLDMLDVEGIGKVFEVFYQQVSTSINSPNGETIIMPLSDIKTADHTLNPQVRNALDIIARNLEVDLDICRHDLPYRHSHDDRRLNKDGNESPIQATPFFNSTSRSHCRLVDGDKSSLLQRLMKYHVDEKVSAQTVALNKIQCSKEIDILSLEECIFLLQTWLVSLAASDASVVVTLREIFDTSDMSFEERNHPTPQRCDSLKSFCCMCSCRQADILPNKTRILESQSSSSAGKLSIKYPNTTFTRIFSYQVTLLDLGPKPAAKILHKIRNEEQFCFEAAAGFEMKNNSDDT